MIGFKKNELDDLEFLLGSLHILNSLIQLINLFDYIVRRKKLVKLDRLLIVAKKI